MPSTSSTVGPCGRRSRAVPSSPSPPPDWPAPWSSEPSGWPGSGIVLIPFIVVGPLLVLAYNAELFGGIVHTTAGFALAWGAFPVLTGYVAQTSDLRVGAVLAAGAAFALSWAQRVLSTPARRIRRSTRSVEGSLVQADGTVVPLDEADPARLPSRPPSGLCPGAWWPWPPPWLSPGSPE